MSKRRRKNQYPDDGIAETPPAATPAPSRSQKKREAKAVVPLAVQLVGLTPQTLKSLALEPDLYDDIVECQRLKRAARQRQLKRIAAGLRNQDWRAIQDALTQ